MRLDVAVLRYLTREDWRVLMAIEMGMKVKAFSFFALLSFTPLVNPRLLASER
jgi:RIO-like serine/threonine protein kinase